MQPDQVWFLGVSTAGSLIHLALPRWAALLGRPLHCRGVDLPAHAAPAAYRRFLADLSRSPFVAGAVITSHKTALYSAAAAQFTELDDLAHKTSEINAVRRTDAGLVGWARDPVSVGRVVDRIWPEPGADLICFGGGGTAVALLTHLAGRADTPGRAIVCETREARVAELRAFVAALRPGFEIEVRLGAAADWDELLAEASPGCLAVNATGLGKDRPGSPIGPDARFPTDAVAWELNYRGSLDFLRTARAAGASAHDGWSLFCQGWAAALTPILGLPDDPALGDAFAVEAAELRP